MQAASYTWHADREEEYQCKPDDQNKSSLYSRGGLMKMRIDYGAGVRVLKQRKTTCLLALLGRRGAKCLSVGGSGELRGRRGDKSSWSAFLCTWSIVGFKASSDDLGNSHCSGRAGTPEATIRLQSPSDKNGAT